MQPTTGAAHAQGSLQRGSPRSLAHLQKGPLLDALLRNHYTHCSLSQRLCTKTLEKTHLRLGEVPDAPAHVGAALTGTGWLRRPTENPYGAPRGPILTYDPYTSAARQLKVTRRARAMPRQCVAIYDGGATIPADQSSY